jgi:hypothetical protein
MYIRTHFRTFAVLDAFTYAPYLPAGARDTNHRHPLHRYRHSKTGVPVTLGMGSHAFNLLTMPTMLMRISASAIHVTMTSYTKSLRYAQEEAIISSSSHSHLAFNLTSQPAAMSSNN